MVLLIQVVLKSCYRLRTSSMLHILNASWHSLLEGLHFFVAYSPCCSIPKMINNQLMAKISDNDPFCSNHWTHISFFRFKIVLLFDTLDATTGCITSIFKCSTSLFHSNNFTASQTFHFQCSIQVPDRNRYQFIVTYSQIWARRQGCLKIKIILVICVNEM